MARKSIRKKLQGQVALVTGGGRGIGAAVAELLARAGAAVVVTARGEDEIERVAATIRRAGGQAIAVPCDVSDFEPIEGVVEAALAQYHRIDILVNNAGILWPVDEVVEADPDEWAYNIHVNLVGPFNMARSVLPVMIHQGYGRILNVTSGAAKHVVPGWSAYCAAKAGLDMFTHCLAEELRGTGVTVNALSPGMVDTDMQADIRSVDTAGTNLDYSHFHAAYARGELRRADEVARMIYWLVGPWSVDRTGEIFDHDNAAWVAQVEREIV